MRPKRPATIALRYPLVMVREQARVQSDVDAARELFRDRGWLEDPVAYHTTPPSLTDPTIGRCRSLGIDYERLEFESLYEPHPGEPGRERWLSQIANRTVPVWVLRHRTEPRPWLVCIHGFQMGFPAVDFAAFHARRFHLRYGMNLALPVLPLHGPRRAGRQSGAGFLSGDFVDTVHAEAQAMLDIRRLLSWIRAQGEPPIGAGGNTGLAAHSAEFERRVYDVTDGVHVAVGYGLANSILIEGDDGVIIVDTMESIETARATEARENDLVPLAGAHEAETPLALVQAAFTGADVALHPPVVTSVPVAPPTGIAAHVHHSTGGSAA